MDRFLPNHVNVFERPDFELFTSEHSIYDTLPVSYVAVAAVVPGAVSAQHQFVSHHFPSHDSVTVRIRPERTLTAEERDRVVIKNVSGRRTFVQKARWQNGWLAGKFRQFGTYQAILDMEPPTVNAPPANLARATRIVFIPKDNMDAIRSFRAELDGRWLRFTNDKGASWIYTFDEQFTPGTHELKVTIEDEAGNVTTRSWTVTR
jgi:hypothetical protein